MTTFPRCQISSGSQNYSIFNIFLVEPNFQNIPVYNYDGAQYSKFDYSDEVLTIEQRSTALRIRILWSKSKYSSIDSWEEICNELT